MNKSTAALAAAVVAVWLIAGAVALSTYTASFTNTGEILNVHIELYADKQGTPLATLAWGTISNGTSIARTIYIKNTGNKACTLAYSTTNMPAFLSLAWNYTGSQVAVNQTVAVNQILTISPEAQGTFSFATHITATEA